jgi:plasmid replication initiation protein
MGKSKTELVVKSNRIIEASYRLSLVEQQIILFAICRSREEQRGLSPHSWLTIDAEGFAKQFGTDKKNAYRQLQEAASTLYDRSITLHDIDPDTGEPRKIETRWIEAKARIDNSGKIQLMFASLVIPFITRLGEDGGFTSYRLEKIGGMSSAHAVRLYELLVQYLAAGSREIEIAWLKETLQINGQYAAIKDLKKYVIDLAVDQINEHSDIRVSYTQRRTGRTVTHLIFDVKTKPEPKNAKTPTKIALPDSVTAPVVRNADNQAVKDARAAALAAVRGRRVLASDEV